MPSATFLRRLLGAALFSAAATLLGPGEARAEAPPAPTPGPPAPAGAAGTITMDDAVAIALQRNRDIIAARLDIQSAKVDRIAAGLYWNPSVSASVSNFSLGESNPDTPPTPLARLVYSVGVSEVIDVWAKRRTRIKAADVGIEYRTLLVEDSLRDIVYAVRSAFTDVIREQLEYQLANEMKSRYDETIKLTRSLAQAGQISEFDFRKIELEGLKYQNALVDEAMELDLARNKLSNLVGLPSATNLPSKATHVDPSREPPAMTPILNRAIAERPDLKAAKKGREYTDAGVETAKNEAYPDISVGAQYTHSEFTVSGDNSNTLALTMSLPIPVFDKNQAGIARARLEQQKNENEVSRVTLRVQHDVAEAVRRMERSDALLDVYEQGGMLQRAENQLRVAESSYRAGANSLLELLEAQRTYIETRSQYLQVQHDYRQATVDVAHAIGGRFP
jgi:cobalt-zinc-cadmium efflux system outer membrane protein